MTVIKNLLIILLLALAGRAGWQSQQVWIDDDQLFSMHYLTAC
jgi:hypothetical protein